MAFTIDLTGSEDPAVPAYGLGKHFVMKRTVDFTDTDNQLVNTGTMGLFLVPADVLIQEVMLHITTADTDITDVDIGRYSTAGVVAAVDGFVDGATLAATGYIRDVLGETYSADTGTAGHVQATAWAIGLINNDAQTINEAIIEFIVTGIDLR